MLERLETGHKIYIIQNECAYFAKQTQCQFGGLSIFIYQLKVIILILAVFFFFFFFF